MYVLPKKVIASNFFQDARQNLSLIYAKTIP